MVKISLYFLRGIVLLAGAGKVRVNRLDCSPCFPSIRRGASSLSRPCQPHGYHSTVLESHVAEGIIIARIKHMIMNPYD